MGTLKTDQNTPSLTPSGPSIDRAQVLKHIKRFFNWPILFLAVIPRQEVKTSGSEAIELFCLDNGTHENSDLDMYVPHRVQAI